MRLINNIPIRILHISSMFLVFAVSLKLLINQLRPPFFVQKSRRMVTNEGYIITFVNFSLRYLEV